MATELSVREMRLRLQRMDRELEEIIAASESMARDAAPAMVEAVRAARAHKAEPRSPFTHSSSEVEDPEGHKTEAYKAWAQLNSLHYWLGFDARRRIRSADRALRHHDDATPALPHLKQERRPRRV